MAGLRWLDAWMPRALVPSSPSFVRVRTTGPYPGCTPGRGDLREIALGRHVQLVALNADGLVLEVDLVFDAEAVIRMQRHHLALLADHDGLGDLHVAARRFLHPQTGVGDQLGERRGRAVDDRHLFAVDLDDCVIHAHAHQGAHQMLHRGDHEARAGDGRGEAGARDRLGTGLHAIASADIGPNENDSRIRRRRLDHQTHQSAGMQADAVAREAGSECSLVLHNLAPFTSSRDTARRIRL